VAVLEQGDLPTPEELLLLQRTESRLVELAEGRLSPEARAELGTLLREVVEDDHGIPIRDEEIGADWLPRVRTWRQLQEAERAYHFQQSEESLDLILCDELVGEEHVAIVGQTYTDYLRNWEKFARGGVRVHRVAGDHLGVLRPPHVSELSAVVVSLLDGGAAK
jgi:thioesterase domain-containing protein